MGNFFSIMIIISTMIAIISSIAFSLGSLIKNNSVFDYKTFSVCVHQINACRVSSVVFTALYWFVVSGLPQKQCLAGYAKISAICSKLGSIWIIFAFINIVLSFILCITKREKEDLSIMEQNRNSGFFMGALFLIIAFVLKVD